MARPLPDVAGDWGLVCGEGKAAKRVEYDRGRGAMEADEKECPFCAEIIKAKAKVCRHCQRELPPEVDASQNEAKRGQQPSPVMVQEKTDNRKNGIFKRFLKGCAQVCIGLFVLVAAFGLFVEYALNTKKEATPSSTTITAETVISAESLIKEFSENKEASENKYGNKVLLISGEVKSATPGVFSGAYFVMTTASGDL